MAVHLNQFWSRQTFHNLV